MIKIIEGNLLDSNANFIVHACDCKCVMESNIAEGIFELFPHVEKEYRKLVHHYDRNNENILGLVQYVPSDVWAVGMVDTMKNDDVPAYDSNYQYIANLVCQDVVNGNVYTDLHSMKEGLMNVLKKAKAIGAAVALPYYIGRKKDWNKTYALIQDVFGNSNIDVEIWK